MKTTSLKKALITASILVSAGFADIALGHSGGATLDPAGTNATATDLAAVTCFDDGNGAPHHLLGQIKDMSPAVPGLYLSFHIYKGNQMITTTDTVSGDANYSQEATLNGGPGVYYISATKTAAGVRIFDVIWHCVTSQGAHTGTDLAVLQFQ
ncbi:MAG: hypothetical protein PHG00_07070 [Methylococcales bacterium]|nr:hypothetical protein [Methylococcales bacterium]